jgi:dTDP-4-amino-4,6-dideoxygalactose transaminase
MAECPVTEDVSDRIVRLPFYTSMTEEEQGRVIQTVLEWKSGKMKKAETRNPMESGAGV